MKFDKAKDPAACAAKSPTRYAVQGVAVVEKGDATFLAATDGRSLSMVRAYPQDGDDMPSALGNGRIYPPAAFAAARKACKRCRSPSPAVVARIGPVSPTASASVRKGPLWPASTPTAW